MFEWVLIGCVDRMCYQVDATQYLHALLSLPRYSTTLDGATTTHYGDHLKVNVGGGGGEGEEGEEE